MLGPQNVEYLLRKRSARLQQPTEFFHELTLRFTQPAICQQYVDRDGARHHFSSSTRRALAGLRLALEQILQMKIVKAHVFACE